MAGLEGRRVLVTRAREDADAWAAVLEAAGAVALVLPCIECVPLDDPTLATRLAAALADADWLVVTSRRGVESVSMLLSEPLPPHLAVAVVGPATAQAARDAFGRVDFMSERGTGADLAARLVERLAASHAIRPRVVAAVAENAATTNQTVLRAATIECTRIDVYRTIPAPAGPPRESAAALGVECILLASPSAVAGFLNRVELDRPTAIYTIGPATTAAARAAGLDVRAEAREPSLEGLLESMKCTN